MLEADRVSDAIEQFTVVRLWSGGKLIRRGPYFDAPFQTRQAD
jgi:hypothetical protein